MGRIVNARRSRVRAWSRAAGVLALAVLAACGPRRPNDLTGPIPLSHEVRQILMAERPTREYYDARARLREMGPEVDAVLVALARDPRARPVARANALVLLVDRGSPIAFTTLQRALLTEEVEMLRSAAVLALQRLDPGNEAAAGLIRSALGDPARTVRLNALQSLDIRDVEAIRALLEDEPDREVRQVAMQLVSLAESRGAPLAPDRRGALRTAGPDTDPHIVFRPALVDSVADYATGDLRVELPNAPDLPLAPRVEVVRNVLPAFFAPDRSAVVFEIEREIRVVDLSDRSVRSLGPGIAPRLIPFTHQFVFLRELPGGRREVGGDATEIRYEVLRAGFGGGAEPERLGEMQALARTGVHGNYSAVRWMVVGEGPEGFVLHGAGVTPFAIPTPVWRPGMPGVPPGPPPAAYPDGGRP
jgi:HEAT repeat protein